MNKECPENLGLLQRLRDAVTEFARLEISLQREFAARRHGDAERLRMEAERLSQSAEERLARCEMEADAEIESIRHRYEQRGRWLRRAHVNALRDAPKNAQLTKERWMGNLQLKHFEGGRQRERSLQEVEEHASRSGSQLGEHLDRLRGLEKRARAAVRGYPSFACTPTGPGAAPDLSPDQIAKTLEAFPAELDRLDGALTAFRQLVLPRLFSIFPPVLWAVLVAALGVWLGLSAGGGSAFVATGAGIVGGGLLFAVYLWSLAQASPKGRALVSAYRTAQASGEVAFAAATNEVAEQRAQIEQDYEHLCGWIQEQWDRSGTIEAEFEAELREKIQAQARRIGARIEATGNAKLAALEDAKARDTSAILAGAEAGATAREGNRSAASTNLDHEERSRRETLRQRWKEEVLPLYHEAREIESSALRAFPPWNVATVDAWSASAAFVREAPAAWCRLDLAASPKPSDEEFGLPGPASISLPITLGFPECGSLLLESAGPISPAEADCLNGVVLRLLSVMPPGKVAFTLLDPVGLGENFAGLMHLADFEESVINRKIWTQRDQIEARLTELGEHIEKVIQMYLRNEYATISEYNAVAGSVAEKYHFLVIADCPAQFSETAIRRLQSIVTSGPRCGVFTLIHRDTRLPIPSGLTAADFAGRSLVLRREAAAIDRHRIPDLQTGPAIEITLEQPPSPELAAALVHKIGKRSIDANRVEVAFELVAPTPDDSWSTDTTSELRVPIGRTAATKLQYLALGKGTRQHALFAGKTGSGKSTLFHVIVTNLALRCSPDQVEFYLIDFKKGVEFKCYASKRIPHARVVAIESDREFALSVLERVDEELRKRGDLFRELGVQDVPGYKRAGGKEPMPRTLLIIDEFQEFFVEEDSIAQTASLLLDRIVRQGRAFGIHVLLGSQTLGGAYTLARATIGQMVVRVALQCSEADSYLIMDDSNPAPRLLSRPGEGIYNDAAGATEGNSPFQVVWLPDEERDKWLDTVRDLSERRGFSDRAPVVFEGNSPAAVADNRALDSALSSPPRSVPAVARMWLGAPNAIKGPTEAVIRRQAGAHLLIVGQREEPAVTLAGLGLLALAAQYPVGGARFVVAHSLPTSSADAVFLSAIASAIPHGTKMLSPAEVADAVGVLAEEVRSRIDGGEEGREPIFFFLLGLQRMKKIRYEEEFSFGDAPASAGSQLNEIICEGGACGVHVIALLDTYASVGRSLSRKALGAFEMRTIFQMSANDSASLTDSPKAAALGMHRALYYNEHEGALETFRPYARPDAAWLKRATELLGAREKAAEAV